MPRAEPLNDKIVQALESRKRRAELLRQQKQHQYARAIQLITQFRGNITKLSQIAGLCRPNKITKPIFDEIEEVLAGRADVEVPVPSPAVQARAEARGPVEQRLPNLASGGAAILLVLYRESLKPTGARYMTKDQIRERATRELHVNMYDESSGFSRWSNIKQLEDKGWVHRENWSRRIGGAGSGRFGGRKDEFSITDEGKAAAARLETELRRQSGGLSAAPRTSDGHRRAAAAHFSGSAYDGDEEEQEQDPFAALLGGILTGPQFTGGAAASVQRRPAAGTAAGTSPFSGRGCVLGQGGPSSRPTATAAAVGCSGGGVDEYFDEDLAYDVDAQGFPIYQPELFEPDETTARPQTQQQQNRRAQAAVLAAAAQTTANAPPSAGAAASLSGAGTGTAALAALTGLMPKVRKSDKREPLCAPDGSCVPCMALTEFLEDGSALTLPMLLNKKQQQHVQQRVAYLKSPEGGQWALAITVGADKSVTVRKQQEDHHEVLRPLTAAAKLDPLAELANMLGKQQQLQHPQPPSAFKQPAAPRVEAAPHTAADARLHTWSGTPVKQQMKPAQMAAAAAEARARQQEHEEQQCSKQHHDDCSRQQPQRPHHHHHLQQQQQPAVDQPIILDSQLEDPFAHEGPAGQGVSEPEQVDFLLDSQWDMPAVLPTAAAAATPRKRRRQQAPDSTACASHDRSAQHQGSVDLVHDSQEFVIEALGHKCTGNSGRKRQRRQLQDKLQQQQQPSTDCISLLESQDTDLLPSGLGSGGMPGGAGPCSHMARQTHLSPVQHRAPAVGGSSGDISTELKLVVDNKERRTESAPNQVYQYIRQDCSRLLNPALPQHMVVDVDRDDLPLGDYAWLVLNTAGNGHDSTAAAAMARARAADAEGSDEAAAAEERSRCVVAGAVVERKVIRDIVGRSAGGDHIRQLQRMYQFRDALPKQLLVLENRTQLAENYTVYSSQRPSQSHSAIYDEASLFDFIVRAAVSGYGTTQKILLAPSTEDTRSILLATTQLLVYELYCDRQQGKDAPGLLTYPQLKQQVNEVNRRLPRWDLPAELSYSGAAEIVPPDTAFRISDGTGEFLGLKLYSHKTFKGHNHLHLVYVQGKRLLMLLDIFHQQVAEGGGVVPVGQLPVIHAVEVACEMSVLLSSFLDSFITASTTAASAMGGANCGHGCCMLVVDNLFGSNGAVGYMSKAQQAAALENGRPATKKAAEQQAAMCKLNGTAIKQHIWLWLVCFALKQGWHIQLCQSANSVGLFLQTAGSRCCCFAQSLQQQNLTAQRQQRRQQQQRSQQPAELQQQQQHFEEEEPEVVVAGSEGEEDVTHEAHAAADRATHFAGAHDAQLQQAIIGKAQNLDGGFAAWLEQLTASDVVAAAQPPPVTGDGAVHEDDSGMGSQKVPKDAGVIVID